MKEEEKPVHVLAGVMRIQTDEVDLRLVVLSIEIVARWGMLDGTGLS